MKQQKIKYIAAVMGILITGGTVTVAGIKYQTPGLVNLKDFIVSDRDIFERFTTYRSDEPVALVEVKIKNNELLEVRIIQATNKLKQILNFSDLRSAPLNHDLKSVFEGLKDWMHPDDYSTSNAEYDIMMDNYRKGFHAKFTKPILFNWTFAKRG